MCTATWSRDDQGLHFYFNRDESRLRPAGIPPMIWEEKIPFLAPKDPLGGGSWLGVNNHGLVVALLNYYPRDYQFRPREEYKTRGGLVAELLQNSSFEGALDQACHLVWEDFAPCTVLLLDTQQEGALQWDGARLRNLDLETSFISSSGYCHEEVTAIRFEAYTKWKETSDSHRRFHFSQNSQGGSYSILMNREDAQTVSYTEIHLSLKEANMVYQGLSEGKVILQKRLSLPIADQP